jgi:autotransporter-associated beta strand protein
LQLGESTVSDSGGIAFCLVPLLFKDVIYMSFRSQMALAALAISSFVTSNSFGAPFTVNSVGVMDPNPYGLTILSSYTTNANVNSDPLAGPLPGGTGLTLTAFQGLIQGDNGAFARDNGGVLDAQQIWQGGSWPANAGGNNNGATMADTLANPITATYGATQANTIQFWRTLNAVVNTQGIDSNVNNGNSVVSGGGQNPIGGGGGSINFATGIFNDFTESGSVNSGGGYIGIQGNANFDLNFTGPAGTPAAPVSNLTAFGVTQVTRGAARSFRVVGTFSDGTTYDTGLINVGAADNNFVGFSAPTGQTITRVEFTDPNGSGFVRFDDLAFVTSAPADTGGWQSASGGSWGTPGNWATGVVPSAVGASASFRGALSTSGNIALDGNKTVGQVIFVNGAASYTIVPGTGGNLTIDNTGGFGAPTIAADAGTHSINVPVVLTNATTQIYVDNDARLNIGGNISDTGGSGIVKVGNGFANLSGNNTYSGTTTVTLGTLNVGKPSGLPGYNTAGRVVVNAGGTLSVGVGGAGQWQAADIDGLLANATFAAHQTITPSRLGFDTTGGDFAYGSVITGNQGIDKIGSNTLTLTGTNTYTGPTRILGGTLSVASIAQNLGTPIATAGDSYSAVLGVGSGTNGGTLLYTGVGENTNRIVDMTGTTGGATIDQSGTGALVFGGLGGPGSNTLATSRASVTSSGAGNKILTLKGSTSGTGEIQGLIIDHQTTANALSPAALTSVVKAGTGTWTLSGINTYTGSTTVQQGKLVLNTFGAIDKSTQIILSGGTLSTGGFSQNLSTATLQVTASSTIDMANPSNLTFDSLQFGDSSAIAWTAGAQLRIDNWSPGANPDLSAGLSPVTFAITSGTGLTAAQLSQIKFTGFFAGATISSNNFGEIVPANTSVQLKRGDFNFSGVVDAADIRVMLKALTNLSTYQNTNSSGHVLTIADLADVADINRDGSVTNADIQAELDLIASLGGGAVAAVPEPTTAVLLLVGGIMLAIRVRVREQK